MYVLLVLLQALQSSGRTSSLLWLPCQESSGSTTGTAGDVTVSPLPSRYLLTLGEKWQLLGQQGCISHMQLVVLVGSYFHLSDVRANEWTHGYSPCSCHRSFYGYAGSLGKMWM